MEGVPRGPPEAAERRRCRIGAAMAVLLVVLPLMLMRVFLGDQADSIDALLRQAHVKQQSTHAYAPAFLLGKPGE